MLRVVLGVLIQYVVALLKTELFLNLWGLLDFAVASLKVLG